MKLDLLPRGDIAWKHLCHLNSLTLCYVSSYQCSLYELSHLALLKMCPTLHVHIIFWYHKILDCIKQNKQFQYV